MSCRPSAVACLRLPDGRCPNPGKSPYPLSCWPVPGIWYRYQLPPLGVKLHYGQSKYKWEIEYIFVHSIYRFIRRQTKIADSFEPAFCRVRAYTKRLLKLAKHLPKFSSFFFAIGFFHSFAFNARIERHFCQTVDSCRAGAAVKRGRGRWLARKK